MEDSSKYAGTPKAVFNTRSISRRLEAQRWSEDAIKAMTGVPWKPYGFTHDDTILIRMPRVVQPRVQELAAKVRKLEE